jgi:lysylphosphatidylglycerol synthetase-like protein (DUF2156 family)
MNLAKLNKKLEIFWWWMAGISLVLVVILTFADGWDKWAIYYFAPVIASVLALVRRFLAKRLAASEAFRDENAKKN